MTTVFYVSRETADERASDEDRAMSSASIYQGDDLDEAQNALSVYLRKEAGYLTLGRDIVNPVHLWAFKRAVALVELADNVSDMDPTKIDSATATKIATREVAGLMFTITAVTR